MTLRNSRAWRLKEIFGSFWRYYYEGSARKFIGDWFAQITRSRLSPMKKVAEMFDRHLLGLPS
ncbi:MAG: transposase [Chthoniobacterales bacterium]|jgi:hypothetical protein|nr:transposase [Chthoniobacterales bacterium]